MANWTLIILLMLGFAQFSAASEDIIIDATTENINEFDQLLQMDMKAHKENKKEKLENIEKQEGIRERIRSERRMKRNLLKGRDSGAGKNRQ